MRCGESRGTNCDGVGRCILTCTVFSRDPQGGVEFGEQGIALCCCDPGRRLTQLGARRSYLCKWWDLRQSLPTDPEMKLRKTNSRMR